MAISFVTSLVMARALFPLYSINHDDAMYVYEARLLNEGDLTLPAGEHEFFRPWASGVRDDRVVMKYAPPWPAVLAVSERLTGSFLVGPAAVAAGAVGLVYLLAREIWRDRRRVALVAAGVFALSPVTLIQSGTFLPYLFQLVTGLGFAVCLLAGLRRESPRLLALSGVALGVGLFARPFDAVLFALPFVTALVWSRRDRWAELARVAGFVACGAAPVVGLDLLYNAHTMGNPLSLPFTVTGPYDTVGFGRRGIFADGTFNFTPRDGVEGLTRNLQWFPSWSFGGIVTFLLAGVAVVVAARAGWRRHPWLWATAGVAVSVCAGYVFFWSPFSMSDRWPGVETLGPFYHLAVLVPVVLLGAYGLDVLLRGTTLQRRLAMGAAGIGMVLTVLALSPKIEANAEVRDEFEALDDQVDALRLRDAVLVLPARGNDGFMSPTPFLENRPDLDQSVLYAEDRGAENLALFDRHPDRDIVQLVQQLETGDEMLEPSLVPTPLRLEGDGQVRLDLTLTNVTEHSRVIAYVSDGRTRQEHLLDDASHQGEAFSLSWELSADGQAAPADGAATTAAPAGGVPPVRRFAPRPVESGTLTVGFAVGSGTDEVADTDQRWERRFPYRIVDGELQLVRPGRGYELFAYAGERRWLAKDVDGFVDEGAGP